MYVGNMQRYGEEVGKSLLEGVKQERNCSEDISQYNKMVTELQMA
jgi:hypothetical protein